jgi:ADP-heptose:LPS heptosyltransferase
MASLIIRPEKIGDLIVSTPVFRALKESFPNEEVHLLTDELGAELVRHNPYLDRIIAIPWKSRARDEHLPLRDIYRLLRQNGPYRRAVILYFSWNPWNWLLALLRIPRVAQITGTWSALLWRHQMVLRNNHVDGAPMSELLLRVAEQVGAIPNPDPAARWPRLDVTAAERQALLERFPSLAPAGRIFLHPFSVTGGANLAPQNYFDLARHLADTTPPYRIYLVGTAAEAAKVTLPQHPRISTELIGQLNLRELLAACALADLVIGGSSGVLHIAGAVGTPALGLYCPCDQHDRVWGPQGKFVKILTPPLHQCRRHDPTAQSPCAWPPFCNLSFAFTFEQIRQEAKMLLLQKAERKGEKVKGKR